MQDNASGVGAREPSFTAVAHAWARNAHATIHPSPILSDTRSVQLIPEQTRQRCKSFDELFSPETVDAIRLMAVIRHRLLADRLPDAYQEGIRQLVILGAGLDTTGFALPAWGDQWRVFEVDEPTTQEWKRQQIAAAGWEVPSNLVFAPCDFETQDMLGALAAAGFQRQLPALVSFLGVILYLTADATKAALAELATLAPGSEVIMTYSSPPDGTDPVVEETFQKASPTADEAGESFVGSYHESQMEQLVRQAGFRDAIHHPVEELNARYFAGRPDGLRLRAIEQLLTAVR
jgi:methyltransferase (TIGR00027 family)